MSVFKNIDKNKPNKQLLLRTLLIESLLQVKERTRMDAGMPATRMVVGICEQS